MPVHYTRESHLGPEAVALIEFDMGSIRQMVIARKDPEPAVWVADPLGYERDGHVMRDSDSVRLLSWVEASGMIYATDGCNSCWHNPTVQLTECSSEDLKTFSEHTQLPLAMLELLAAHVKKKAV